MRVGGGGSEGLSKPSFEADVSYNICAHTIVCCIKAHTYICDRGKTKSFLPTVLSFAGSGSLQTVHLSLQRLPLDSSQYTLLSLIMGTQLTWDRRKSDSLAPVQPVLSQLGEQGCTVGVQGLLADFIEPAGIGT